MTMMQAMFAQQALANQQQQQAMLAHQAHVANQQAEANQQLQLLLAKSLDRQLDQQHKQLKHQENLMDKQAIADVRVAVKQLKEGTNIVQYLEHFETELEDAQIPLAKWKQILVSKLSTKAEKVCAHLVHSEATYQDLKRHLLANIGPSADELCNIMHGAVHTEFLDKPEAQKLQHAKYISERYFLGIKSDNTIIEYVAVRLFKFHCHKRFSHVIKLSKSHLFAELLEMATTFDSQLDYEKATKPYYSHTKQSHKKVTCDFCKKSGHVEAECFKKQGLHKQNTSYKPQRSYNENQQAGSTKHYKSTNKDTGIKPRPATVNWSQTKDTVKSIKGTVNGHKVDIILDTGAQITVVPGKYIYEDNLTGHTVDIMGINGSPRPYQTAIIPITINNIQVEEKVAVAPEDQLNSRVLLATPMCETATQHLIDSYLDKNVNTRRCK